MPEKQLNDIRSVLFQIILTTPGIRYNDLIRITKINHGVLSYSLDLLEKKYLVKSFRRSNGRITRYYSTSISEECFSIIGYLKNKTTRGIILYLHIYNEKNFTEIKNHIGKASSTTFWNIRRLIKDAILIEAKSEKGTNFALAQPILILKIIESFDNNLPLDRAYNTKNYAYLTNPV